MKRAGLTFIELMLGIVILSLIMLSVYGVFSIGLRIWQRNKDDNPLSQVRLAFLKIDKELKNTFFFSEIPFKGSEYEVSFPLAVNENGEDGLFIVSYLVRDSEDHIGKELVRKENPFHGAAYNDSDSAKSRKMIASLKSARFSYAYSDNTSYKWLPYWDGARQGRIPSGIRISLEVKGGKGFYNKVIFIQNGELGIR